MVSSSVRAHWRTVRGATSAATRQISPPPWRAPPPAQRLAATPLALFHRARRHAGAHTGSLLPRLKFELTPKRFRFLVPPSGGSSENRLKAGLQTVSAPALAAPRASNVSPWDGPWGLSSLNSLSPKPRMVCKRCQELWIQARVPNPSGKDASRTWARTFRSISSNWTACERDYPCPVRHRRRRSRRCGAALAPCLPGAAPARGAENSPRKSPDRRLKPFFKVINGTEVTTDLAHIATFFRACQFFLSHLLLLPVA
jgi:hypothetical protein